MGAKEALNLVMGQKCKKHCPNCGKLFYGSDSYSITSGFGGLQRVKAIEAGGFEVCSYKCKRELEEIQSRQGSSTPRSSRKTER